MQSYAESKELDFDNTVEYSKFAFLGTTDFISKCRKFEL